MAINGIGNAFADVSELGFSNSSAVNDAGGPNRNGCGIDDELTTQDKAIVTGATGSLDLPNRQINMLAMQIALDRYTGHLEDP